MRLEPVSSFKVGEVTVSSTVPTQLPDITIKPLLGVHIRAEAGAIHFGDADVITNYYVIAAAGEIFLPISTLTNLFFIAANNGDKISYCIT